MRINIILAVALTVVLTGCSMTLPVKGRMQNTKESFSGTATGQLDGAGDLTIISSTGAVCEGNFVYVTKRKGEGVFICDDGRSGPFEFVSTGRRGTGFGDLSGQRFTFTFGK